MSTKLKFLSVILGLALVGAFYRHALREQELERARLEATIVELRGSLAELSRAPRDSLRVLKETTRVVQPPAASASAAAALAPSAAPSPAEWEKQTVARCEQRLAADRPDPEWSSRQEARVDEVLRASGETNPFSEVVCRGAMCKLTGHFASIEAYNHIFRVLFGSPDAVEHGGVYGFPSYAPDGSMEATLYLGRKDTSYAFAD